MDRRNELTNGVQFPAIDRVIERITTLYAKLTGLPDDLNKAKAFNSYALTQRQEIKFVKCRSVEVHL